MGATLTISHLLRSGDHIICSDGAYGGTSKFFESCLSQFNIKVTFVDATNPSNIETAFQSNTKLVWLETPTNPFQYMIDIAKVVQIVRRLSNETLIVVDNTSMTPYYQKPLKYGVDITMQSLSKYINGTHKLSFK
jgi:cystathionine gamma-lyase